MTLQEKVDELVDVQAPWREWSATFREWIYIPEKLKEAFLVIVMEEREACAKIAEEFFKDMPTRGWHPDEAVEEIAAKIRARKDQS